MLSLATVPNESHQMSVVDVTDGFYLRLVLALPLPLGPVVVQNLDGDLGVVSEEAFVDVAESPPPDHVVEMEPLSGLDELLVGEDRRAVLGKNT